MAENELDKRPELSLARMQAQVLRDLSGAAQALIAEAHCDPAPTGPWHGRDLIIQRLCREKGIDEAEAAAVVDVAVAELFGADSTDAVVRRKLALTRLRGLMAMAIKSLNAKRREQVFKFEDRIDPKTNQVQRVRRLDREKIIQPDPLPALEFIRRIEMDMAHLQQLADQGQASVLAQVVQEVMGEGGERKTTATVSLAQKLSRADPSSLSPAAREMFEKGLQQERERGFVPSKVVSDPPESDPEVPPPPGGPDGPEGLDDHDGE